MCECVTCTGINPAGVKAYQSPEPALFTVDVPALDGGQRHRVGVLQRDGEKGKSTFESKGGAEMFTDDPMQHCTSLTRVH